MSRHFQLALRGTITWRPRKRTRTTKTSTWSCGSSPHALTDSLRCVHECRQPQHVTPQYCWRCCCRKWLDALICSCSHGAEDETWIVVFHMEIHVPPLRCSHVTLYIEFSFAYIFRLQFPYFFFFLLEHNTVTQAGSHCGAALQYAPVPHQNKASQCLKGSGESQRKGLAAPKRSLRSTLTFCLYRHHSGGSSSHNYDLSTVN